jgi:serine/threonine protein phosphatase PrpC
LLVRSLPTLADSRPLTLIAVADGISNCPYGGSVARYVVDRHLSRDTITLPGAGAAEGLAGYLRALHDEFRREFADSPDMLASGCTVTAAALCGPILSYCWVGDSPLFVIRNTPKGWAARQLTRPDTDRLRVLTDCFGHGCPGVFKCGDLRLNPDDVVIAATDGACLDEFLLESSLAALEFSDAWLEELARPAQSARFHDDISIIALRHQLSVHC